MIHVELVTLNGRKFAEDVHEVMLPTPNGQIAVFEHHAPLVVLASTGEIAIRRKPEHTDDMLEHYASTGGVIEITNNRVRVLVDEAEADDEIDEQEAQKAYERAKQLQSQARDKVSLDEAQALLDRSAVRLKIAGLRRNRRKTR